MQPFSSNSFLSTLGSVNANNPLMQISPTNAEGFFMISLGGSTTAGRYWPFWKYGVAYQVTAGKTCVVQGMIMMAGTAGSGFQLASATASFANDAASLTGGVYQSGAASNSVYRVLAGNTFYNMSLNYQFSASTYPGIYVSAADLYGIHLFCREV